MAHADLNAALQAQSERNETAFGTRVPFFAILLAYLGASLTAGVSCALLLSVFGDTFSSIGRGWPEVAEMAGLLTVIFAIALLPVFVVGRGLMAWARWRDWSLYALIWALGTLILVSLNYRDMTLADGRLWSLWLQLAAGPAMLAATVQYVIEKTFQRAR